VTSEDRDPLVPDEQGSRSSASAVLDPEKRPARRRLGVWQESVVLVIIAVLVAIVLKQFFVQAFYIPSGSMEPGLQLNDRILVEKPSYWFGGGPQRGDIVVFSDPGGWLSAEEDQGPSNTVTKGLAKIGLYPTGGHLVKRVIGVAGDTIHCCDDQGRLEVNGHPLDEASYARPGTIDGKPCYGPMPGVCDWTAGPVPPGYLFVMGDNRGNSADSSYHLCTKQETECTNSPWVPEHDVVGKVAALAWPLGRAKIEHRPADFAGIPAPSGS
jgi:signal peptidase I